MLIGHAAYSQMSAKDGPMEMAPGLRVNRPFSVFSSLHSGFSPSLSVALPDAQKQCTYYLFPEILMPISFWQGIPAVRGMLAPIYAGRSLRVWGFVGQFVHLPGHAYGGRGSQLFKHRARLCQVAGQDIYQVEMQDGRAPPSACKVSIVTDARDEVKQEELDLLWKATLTGSFPSELWENQNNIDTCHPALRFIRAGFDIDGSGKARIREREGETPGDQKSRRTV